MASLPYPPKNTTAIISGLRGYGRMPYPPNKRGAVETTAPPGDSGGIQTHDLQNFFSTKSFCSKNKKVQQTAETKAAWVYGRMPYPPNKRGAAETAAPPLVIPVGFKPTTFRTFSRPSLSALKIKEVQPRKAAPPGDSGGIQTHDLQNRNLTLYSAKLRNHCDFAVANLRKLFQTDERLLYKKHAGQTFS